jgi:protein O-GlcNAc transferase
VSNRDAGSASSFCDLRGESVAARESGSGAPAARAKQRREVMAKTAFEAGVEYQRAGQLDVAERLYASVAPGHPHYPSARFLLGSIALVSERTGLAMELLQEATRLDPGNSRYRAGLGEAYRRLGQLEQAFDCFEIAFGLEPQFAQSALQLAELLEVTGQLEIAAGYYEHLVLLQPGNTALAAKLAELRAAAGSAARVSTWGGSSEVLVRAWLALAGAHLALKRPGAAVTACRGALACAPGRAGTLVRLGLALRAAGLSDEACQRFEQALELQPDDLDALLGLVDALRDLGRIDATIPVLHRALAVQENPDLRSVLVTWMPYAPGYTDAQILAECGAWEQHHALHLAPAAARPGARAAGQRLRIGYVSPHFCKHVSQLFVPPLLSNHDHGAVEVCLYSDVRTPDAETEYLRAFADVWRDVAGWSDARLAEQVQADGIDILVNLTMHSKENRLLLFARKPAPVQLCWLAYPGTTGLGAMDYRVTDPHLDPPGTDLSVYRERSLYLPDTFWCYAPRETPEVNALPALQRGHITFGSLNNFIKVNAPLLELWAELLHAVPRARLLLLAPLGDFRTRVSNLLERQGVARERVSFVDRQLRSDYLATYHEIDLGLDPFPCTGHTTSFDAAWMGVPVVTLRGQTVIGRAGVTVAKNLGLPELIADTPEEYLRIAIGLSSDLARLAELRAVLRPRMQASPLVDGPRFARNMEALYRVAWSESGSP